MDVRGLRIRSEVENLRYEPAVDLGDVVRGRAPEFVRDPIAFFERTHLAESMKTLIVKALMNLLGIRSATVGGRRYEVSSNLILLPSDLGGGKTHSLILLYHIFRLISEARDSRGVVEKISMLDRDIADFILNNWGDLKKQSLRVVVIDCKYSDLAPSPVRPIEIAGRRIKTLWGYLGYELGRYDVVKSADERETAPYADDVFKVLDGGRALILIDEIGRYYDQSGLESTKISAFLMNLAEAMSKYTVREVAVVISLPYEVSEGKVEAKPGMEHVHRPEVIMAINEVLSRPSVEIIKPVERQDLAEILRKRIFAHFREEFLRFVEDYMADELSKEYPGQVRSVLDNKGFWDEVKATYPFHPRFLDVLERLAYKLPYLQRTRDAIKIAVQTVLAIREGLFDWLDDEISLIMPYHIPLFVGEVLDETVLRNAPGEYKVFHLILRSNVVESKNFNALKDMVTEEFYEKVVSRPLRGLKEDDMKLGVKLASIVWLHSLVGLGLPMNMGDFPTTDDLIYSVSPVDLDVKGVLGILRSVLPQLIVHGDPESATARWFFTRIPSVGELIEVLKKNVTDEMARSKLAELLEWGLVGKKKKSKGYATKSIFANAVVVKSFGEVPGEVLDSIDPVLIVLADGTSKESLFNLLKGRNNVVVLAPYVVGVHEGEKLSPEDVKGIGELSGFRNRGVWEGLLEMLRYLVATESITEDQIRSFVGERASIGGEEYEALAKDLMNLLRGKVESKKEYYYRNSWNLINRCYNKIYYCRLGEIKYESGLVLERDRPIPSIVEKFLKEKGLIPSEFRGEDLLSVYKNYLAKDPEKEPINVGALWNYIRSTDKASVPLISHSAYIDAVKDLIKSLDFAVKIRGKLLWKPIFDSEREAREKNEGNRLLNQVVEYLRRVGVSWDEVELIYWDGVLDDWLEEVIKSIPRDRMLKVIDVGGRVLDIRDIRFDLKNTIKSGKLFYERRKYIVEMDVNLPTEMWENGEYEGTVSVSVEGFDEEIQVNIKPSTGISIEPLEVKGKSPLTSKLSIKTSRAGDYTVKVKISGKGEVLEERTLNLRVKGKWRERVITIEDVEKIGEGVKVLHMEVHDLLAVPDVVKVAEEFGGLLDGKIVFLNEENKDYLRINVNTNDPRVLKLLWGSINSLARISGRGKVNVDLKLHVEGEPELKNIASRLTNPGFFRFKVKERADGESGV